MTCTLPSTCALISAETDITTQLCYYNKLITNINATSSTYTADLECLSTLASNINANIRTDIGAIDSTEKSLSTTEITDEFNKLLDTKGLDDSKVVKDMYQSNAMVWIILFFILFSIYILI